MINVSIIEKKVINSHHCDCYDKDKPHFYDGILDHICIGTPVNAQDCLVFSECPKKILSQKKYFQTPIGPVDIFYYYNMLAEINEEMTYKEKVVLYYIKHVQQLYENWNYKRMKLKAEKQTISKNHANR